MPGVCGLSAAESIRKLVKEEAGGCRICICMLTADTEGLFTEMERRQLTYGGTISKNGFTKRVNDGDSTVEHPGIDAVAGKPVTFQSIHAILTWFQEQQEI